MTSLRHVSENQKSFVIIQFDKIPTEQEKNELKAEGIELLDYVPNYAYTATITGSLNSSALSARNARAIVTLTAEQKMQVSLASGILPDHAVKIQGMVDVWVNYPRSFLFTEIQTGLKEKGFTDALILPADKNSTKVKVALHAYQNEGDAHKASAKLKSVIGEPGWVYKMK